ncbi:hypothetical protein [Marinicella sp. W31]|uniref:hypothetical protein n=1 Tax=Marinicella sp. W31 TaxID=3023713 RepID=UPI0037577FCF
MKIILTLLILFSVTKEPVAQGLQVPCLDCDKYERNAIPKTGYWGNIQRPGAGFNFEVQNGTLVGSHYAYDENGNQIWYLFSGPLVSSDETNLMWTFEAEMQRFANGQCVNCEYTAPELIPNQGNIKINFHQMGSASYTVDNGERIFIVPFLFGIDGTNVFSPRTDYQFPDLVGRWVFVVDQTLFENQTSFYSDRISFVGTIRFRDRINDDQKIQITYDFTYEATPFDDVVFANTIICTALKNGTEIGAPECFIEDVFLLGFGLRDYFLPIGNITEDRFFAETTDGEILEAFRTKYTTEPL